VRDEVAGEVEEWPDSERAEPRAGEGAARRARRDVERDDHSRMLSSSIKTSLSSTFFSG